MASPPARRSARQRKPNSKYANGLREKETLRMLRESSESSRPTSPDSSDSDEPKTDHDFDLAHAAAAEVVPGSANGDDESLSIASASERGVSDGSKIPTPNESDEDQISIATSGTSGAEDYKLGNSPVGPGSHARGLPNVHRNSSRRESPYTLCWGSTDQEILPVIHARDQWRASQDATFPSVKSLAQVIREGPYGKSVGFGLQEEELRMEATKEWDWYYSDDQGERFRKRQRLDAVGRDRFAPIHLPKPAQQDHSIVIGPWEKQTLHQLKWLEAIDFGMVWEAEATKSKSTENSKLADLMDTESSRPTAERLTGENLSEFSASSPSEQALKSTRHHEGWLLNLGRKVRCLAWAPNRWSNKTQYLAVASACTSYQRSCGEPSSDKRAPAFRPSSPYPSCIQIWSFKCVSQTDRSVSTVDMTLKPRLVQVICTEWGDLRKLAWCPMLRERRPGEEALNRDPGDENLGLLGIISTDGYARVLDVTVLKTDLEQVRYLHAKSAAFAAPPPHPAIYTSLAFASSIDLILGTSLGAICIYNIVDLGAGDPPKPYMTHHFNSSYVLGLAPAYPSASPTMLVVMSASGVLHLTDLRSPSQDTATTGRARLPTLNLVYCPHAATFLTTFDGVARTSQTALVCHPLRRLFNSVTVSRIPGGGTVSATAGSRWHPCILTGTTSGDVLGINYLRKYLASRKRTAGSASGSWMQKLCQYDWIPAAAKDSDQGDITSVGEGQAVDHKSSDERSSSRLEPTTTAHPASRSPEENAMFHGRDTRAGTSRFHEGFIPELVELARSKPTARDKASSRSGGASNKDRDNHLPSAETIYEEEQAVTALDWNPNLACAGWVAIAWGSGIVRIQDVAHGDGGEM